jgi:predicted ATPase
VARVHAEQGLVLYDPRHHRAHAFLYTGHDPGVCGWIELTLVLWLQGYPAQALQSSHKALALAHELAHPFSLVFALYFAAMLHQLHQERQAAQERVEAAITLSAEQGFPLFLALGTILRGWALAEQGQGEEGIAQMRQGLAAWHATGAETGWPYYLALLAEAYGKVGQVEEGLNTLAEALTVVDKNGERFYEAELYRLKGELSLQSRSPKSEVEETSESGVKTGLRQVSDKSQANLEQVQASLGQVQDKSKTSQNKSGVRSPESEAEECFLRAIDTARKQQAKSLELRATMSLVRLRQQQATQYASRITQHETRNMLDEARNILSEIYDWFTEGFDTKDLQEAKALLQELS